MKMLPVTEVVEMALRTALAITATALLFYLIKPCSGQKEYKYIWRKSEYPNPQVDIGKCGRGWKTSWVCDPSEIFNTIKDGDSMDEIINEVREKTACPCSPQICAKHNVGYKMAVAVVPRVMWDNKTLPVDKAEALSVVIDFCDSLRSSQWNFASCYDNLVIFLSIGDQKLWVSTGGVMRLILTDEIVQQIFIRHRILFRDSKYEDGLRKILLDFRSVLMAQLRRNTQKPPSPTPLIQTKTDESTTSITSFDLSGATTTTTHYGDVTASSTKRMKQPSEKPQVQPNNGDTKREPYFERSAGHEIEDENWYSTQKVILFSVICGGGILLIIIAILIYKYVACRRSSQSSKKLLSPASSDRTKRFSKVLWENESVLTSESGIDDNEFYEQLEDCVNEIRIANGGRRPLGSDSSQRYVADCPRNAVDEDEPPALPARPWRSFITSGGFVPIGNETCINFIGSNPTYMSEPEWNRFPPDDGYLTQGLSVKISNIQ